jgi:hypothetical protein
MQPRLTGTRRCCAGGCDPLCLCRRIGPPTLPLPHSKCHAQYCACMPCSILCLHKRTWAHVCQICVLRVLWSLPCVPLQNDWAANIAFATQQGFIWSASGAPAHTLAHVGMLALMFASVEQQQGGKGQLMHGLDCFALSLVSDNSMSEHEGIKGSGCDRDVDSASPALMVLCPVGFSWSASKAPAHTVAHVGMLALMFASAEQQQGGKGQLVHGQDCFALSMVSKHSMSEQEGIRGSGCDRDVDSACPALMVLCPVGFSWSASGARAHGGTCGHACPYVARC